MVRFMSKKDLKPIIKQLKDGGFTVTNNDGWWKAVDDDGTQVMTAMPHSNGSMALNLNNDYFAQQLYQVTFRGGFIKPTTERV